MTYSLNEVEATAKKAARGGGYSWGLAEDAGKAVRWLCAQGQDGCGALSRLLVLVDGTTLEGISPSISSQEWTGKAGVLCPIIVGCALSDLAGTGDPSTVRIRRLAEPLLLLPFAASLARARGGRSEFEWPGGQAAVDETGLRIDGDAVGIVETLSVAQREGKLVATAQSTRAAPDPQDWKTLLSFAHRTYAPATEESRVRGAGADMTIKD